MGQLLPRDRSGQERILSDKAHTGTWRCSGLKLPNEAARESEKLPDIQNSLTLVGNILFCGLGVWGRFLKLLLSIPTLSPQTNATMLSVVNEPGRTFFPCFFLSRVLLVQNCSGLASCSWSYGTSWDCPKEFSHNYSPNGLQECLWFSYLMVLSFPGGFGKLSNLICPTLGHLVRGKILTLERPLNQVIRKTFKIDQKCLGQG